jgi:hypothetical protein
MFFCNPAPSSASRTQVAIPILRESFLTLVATRDDRIRRRKSTRRTAISAPAPPCLGPLAEVCTAQFWDVHYLRFSLSLRSNHVRLPISPPCSRMRQASSALEWRKDPKTISLPCVESHSTVAAPLRMQVRMVRSRPTSRGGAVVDWLPAVTAHIAPPDGCAGLMIPFFHLFLDFHHAMVFAYLVWLVCFAFHHQ